MVTVDYRQLALRCAAPEKDFWDLGEVQETNTGKRIFIDNGADHLAIAHLDFVHQTYHFYHVRVEGVPYVLCPRLDDRLGVYTILDLLPSLGINTDILLTTNEETGNSTATGFQARKQYKFMFQFDRRNSGAVHYMYGTDFLKKRLVRAGFKKSEIEHGSASDICKLQHLGCCGINFATGYKDEHSAWARANMDTYVKQVELFQSFYEKFKDLHFIYQTKTEAAPGTNVWHYEDDDEEGEFDYGKNRYLKKGEEADTVKVNPRCQNCEAVLLSWNQRYTYAPGVLCDTCSRDNFQCVLCGRIHNLTMYDNLVPDVCPVCAEKLRNDNIYKQKTNLMCENPKCTRHLTYGQYISAEMFCGECEAK